MKSNHLIGGIASAALIFTLASCSCSDNNQLGEVADQPVDSTIISVNGEKVSDMIQNISSPVEMANEIKNTGVDFSQSTLNATGQEDGYATNFKKAVNLGVYAADLGYINTFGKNLVVVDYLSSIKRLSDALGVGQFLDYQLLLRMAKDNTNLDSLKQLSVSCFNDIDRYLREQKRSSLSTAIVIGTWIEGLYLTADVITQTKNENLVNRLGEQKSIVEILQIVINSYSRADKDYKALKGKFDELKALYDDVRITTEMGQPVTKEVDGMLVIEQNEVTHVEIAPEQVEAIIAKINEIRESFVKKS